MMENFDYANARQEHLDLLASVVREENRPAQGGRWPIPSSDEVADRILSAKTEVGGRVTLFPLAYVLTAMGRLDPPLDRPMLDRFVMQYDEGAAGFFVDADEVQEVARNVNAALKATDKLVTAIEQALSCTPSIRDGEIIYDCGDPWAILRDALNGVADV